MSRVDWYYARGDSQNGPISPQELRRLAGAGKLAPDDLVWRDGMEDWVSARTVQGLFGDKARSGSASTTPPGGLPSGPTAEAPADAPPAPGQTAVPPAISRAASPLHHPLDAVLDLMRALFPPPLVPAAARLFMACGLKGLYVAMAILIAFTLTVALKTGRFSEFLGGAGEVLLLAVLQYAAGRLLPALDRLIRTTPNSISSAAFPDSFALASLALGVALLTEAAFEAVQTGLYAKVLTGLVIFFVCEYLAVASLNPKMLGASLDPSIPPRKEAVGLLSFLMKALARAVPVAFGAGIVSCVVELLYANCVLFSTDGPVRAPDLARHTTARLVCFAAIPVLAYVAFLVYHLLLDLIRAILVLPARLEGVEGRESRVESRESGERGEG